MKIVENLDLRKHSWLGIGGHAGLVSIETPEELADLKGIVKDSPWRIIGGTSKIIFPDGDFEGYLLRYAGKKMWMEGDMLIVESGMNLSLLAGMLARKGYLGFAGLAGIPGDLGGAIVNNAGAFGDEIGRYVEEIKAFSLKGFEYLTLTKEEAYFSYRDSLFKACPELFVYQIRFSLRKGDPDQETKRMAEAMDRRMAMQPKGVRTLGSIFKNPPDEYAARLLESHVGKGFRIGNIRLSPKHANFFEIIGETTAENISSFIDILYAKVYNERNISLEKEVIMFRW